jgi:phosphohistidine phosphatase SixA
VPGHLAALIPSQRRLTPDGERDALELGDYVRAQDITVDAVLCSSAARARQTLELLKLDDQLLQDRVEIADRFYNAGADTLINAVRELPEDCYVALLVGHAPSAPSVVYELANPTTSKPEASVRSRVAFRPLRWLSWSSRVIGLASRRARSCRSECRAPPAVDCDHLTCLIERGAVTFGATTRPT